MQVTGEIERSDIPYEGDESFEGELSEAVSQDRDVDVSDDLVIVGELCTMLSYQPFANLYLQQLYWHLATVTLFLLSLAEALYVKLNKLGGLAEFFSFLNLAVIFLHIIFQAYKRSEFKNVYVVI